MIALLLMTLWGCGRDPVAVVVRGADGSTQVVDCKTGCAAVTPDEHEVLGDERILELLGEVQGAPVGEATLAVETLLFSFDEVRAYLVRQGAGPLDAAHEAWLRHEISRDQVEVGFRLVAADGTLLGWRDDQIPLVEKHHLLLQETGALGRLDINGKVKRVGVKHLWARF